jgi:hypothetical protein
MTAGMFTLYASRSSNNRPVRCPSMWTWGFSAARIRRLVAGHDNIETGQDLVRKVQRVLEDIHLAAGQEPEVGTLVRIRAIHLGNGFFLLFEALHIQAVRLI